MTKKLLFTSLCIVFFIFNGSAQSFHYGFEIGANMTAINGNGIKNAYAVGGLAGVVGELVLTKKWNFVPAVLYNLSNSKKGDDFLEYYNINGNPDAAAAIKLSYISVPLLFNYKISKILSVDAGPQYSFLVYDNENLLLENKASALKRNDVSIAVGPKVQLENVRFFGRYDFGVVNINNIDNRYKWYNRQFQVGMDVVVF